MVGRTLDPADIPTPGPWLVQGAAEPDVQSAMAMLELEVATKKGSSGGPYIIRRARSADEVDGRPDIAGGINRLADARLMAAAPDLADALLRLFISRDLNTRGIDPNTQTVRDAAWGLLIRVAPHLEIGAGP